MVLNDLKVTLQQYELTFEADLDSEKDLTSKGGLLLSGPPSECHNLT